MNDSDTVIRELPVQEEISGPQTIDINQKKVFIALPIYGAIDPFFFQCVLKLSQEFQTLGIHGQLRPRLGDSAIGRARNGLTREFLETDCTHLLFIDSDLVFNADQIRRILSHDEPIVGGVYCKKQEGAVQLVMNGTLRPVPKRADKLQEVRYIGTGFLCVSREVFKKMIEKYGDEIGYRCDNDPTIKEYDFWQMGVYHFPDSAPRWLSEDWYFCQRALDLGYKVYADTAVLLKHSGGALYPLSYQFKQLQGKQMSFTLDNFDCPPECRETLDEVLGGEYDFGIKFGYAPRIVDVGANIGEFALWAKHIWPEAQLTCYEPNRDIFGCLQNNCRRLKATVVNAAIGDPQKNRLHPKELPECDLLRIDAEGSEVDIVERLEQVPGFMLVEYHSDENKVKVHEALRERMRMVGDKSDREGHGIMAFKKI